MNRSKAVKLRNAILAGSTSLDDTIAKDVPELYERWKEGVLYTTNQRVNYNNTLYRVLQTHTSQLTWNPKDTPSLFAQVLIPDPVQIPEWVQPDSTNPYMTGDQVMYNGEVWESTVDNNVWAPGVYGWIKVE